MVNLTEIFFQLGDKFYLLTDVTQKEMAVYA
jgi:hypothetical protein